MSLTTVQMYLIGFVMVAIILGGGAYMMGTFYNSDSSIDPANGQFNQTLALAATITNNMNTTVGAMDSGTNNNDTGILGQFDRLIGGTYNNLMAVKNTMSFAGSAAVNAGSILGVPNWMTTLIMSIVTIIILFAIWGAIMRVNV